MPLVTSKRVDEEALVDALQQRRIGGAGLDVFWQEPLPLAHPCAASTTWS